MTLERIIQQSKEGKRKAQRLLFELTCDQLKSVAMRYVADPNLAEDVLQETYIRVYKHLVSFNYINDAATYSWMSQITATEALRIIKKNKRWTEINNQVDNKRVADMHLFDDELYKVLMSLPIRQRLVFNMHALEGYSHKEIAAHLNIAESSSRSLLTRARTYLQSQIIKNQSYEKV